MGSEKRQHQARSHAKTIASSHKLLEGYDAFRLVT